jgi:hypothetical protein
MALRSISPGKVLLIPAACQQHYDMPLSWGKIEMDKRFGESV